MSFKGFSIFSSGGHFVQWSGMIFAILVKGHPWNISVKYFGIGPLVSEEMSFKAFFSNFSSGGNFVQWSRTILTILVENYPRNISVKLF